MVAKADRLLAIRQAKGHPLEGQWTMPWGRLEAGESPSAAALRECAEEAAIVAVVEGLLGVQELPDPWPGWIAILYTCKHLSGVPTPDMRETDGARYFSLQEIDTFDEPFEPWSKWLLRRVLMNETKTLFTFKS